MNEKDDRLIPTTCQGCFCQCGVLVHLTDGVVRGIEGDPNNPISQGGVCAKGHSRIMSLYNPYRISKPLKRTNPEKGIGEDPKWVEISWEEALTTIAEKLEKIRQDDPRKLIINTFDWGVIEMVEMWAAAFGTPNVGWLGYYCGNALHPVSYLINGTFHTTIDFEHCNYCLEFGSQHGFLGGVNPMFLTRKMAAARARGMKVVVVDPVCTTAAAKADEWIPIRPGTDAALALAMLDVLLNELTIYDAEFIAQQTNGPYLVDGEGRYLRDQESGKPLVWDGKANEARPYDATQDVAIEGSYVLKEKVYAPAFQRLKDHVRRYSPESVEEVTTVPAQTIRRIATEFGQAARVGSIIAIEGHKLPYRPAAAHCYRGAYAHKHGVHSHLSIQLLNLVVGSVYAVGGAQGAHPISDHWCPEVGPDGILAAPRELARINAAYPPRKASLPEDLAMTGLFPIADNTAPAMELAIADPERFQLPYKPEMLITCRSNLMMTKANPEGMVKALKNIPFVVALSPEVNETAEMADIVLPDTHDMERCEAFPNKINLLTNPGLDHWYFGVRQPVVEPLQGSRNWVEVLLELAERAGFIRDVYEFMNLRLRLKPPYKLDPEANYSWEEISNRWVKAHLGSQYDLNWFKEHGFLKIKKKVEEVYPRPFVKPRFPIYFEFLKGVGEDLVRATQRLGIPWDTADYQPLPEWKPCAPYKDHSPDYHLYAVNFKVPYHSLSYTCDNPWLHEITQRDPYVSKIWVPTRVAKDKGIKTGDPVSLESQYGRVKGHALVTECIHPEVVGIPGIFGHWAKGRPIGRGEGAHFNSLLPCVDLEDMDMIGSGVDACVKVKLSKL